MTVVNLNGAESEGTTDPADARFRRGRWGISPSARGFLSHSTNRALVVYLALYAVFGAVTVPFYPTYSYPAGDEGTYYSSALHPWTLIPAMFEGYRPMQVMSPYNLRIFLTPFSLVFLLFGFTVTGARLIVLFYGLVLLVAAYLVTKRLTTPGYALAAVLLLSLSPPFLYFTHGVRPEGLLATLIMVCLWLIVRHDERVPRRTYSWVGFLSACCLMVHYNGVFLYPLFFVALVLYDWRHVNRRKLCWFILGGAMFAAIFLVVNVLPAWETVREFGVLPVTFLSDNRVRVFDLDRLPRHVAGTAWYYAQYFAGWCSTNSSPPQGPRTAWYNARYFAGWSNLERINTTILTAELAVLAIFGLVYRAGRRELAVGSVVLQLALLVLLVIPMPAWRYFYLVYPFIYVLAATGLGKLPPGRDMKVLSAIVVLVLAGAYAWSVGQNLALHYQARESNRATIRVLRELVARHGDPQGVTVMSAQEFHAGLADTRFRTFHSLITTKDVRETLRLIRPDIVILHQRTGEVILACLLSPGPVVSTGLRRDEYERVVSRLERQRLLLRDSTGAVRFNSERVDELVNESLIAEGYRQYDAPKLTWNGNRVWIFLRSHGRAAHRGSAESRPATTAARCPPA